MSERGLTLRVVGVAVAAALFAGCSGSHGGGADVLPAATSTSMPGTSDGLHHRARRLDDGLSSLGVIALGGSLGYVRNVHSSGDTYDDDEAVSITFTEPVSPFAVAVTPATQVSYGFTSAPGTAGVGPATSQTIYFNLRKTPGVTYTIAVPASVTGADSSTLGTPFSFTIVAETPAVPVASRSGVNGGNTYAYGFLAHPYYSQLLGANRTAMMVEMQQAHTGFVRYDFSPFAIYGTTTCGKPNWLRFVDNEVGLILSHGMTVLPVLTQYGAGCFSGGAGAQAMFATPALYAAYVGAAIAHITPKYPQITRVELFNEPNTTHWGLFPVNGNLASTDMTGAEAALYMQAGYAAVKAANPNMMVVGPALSNNSSSDTVDARQFLQTLYQNGCGAGKCWDELSVHAYTQFNPAHSIAPYMAQSSPARFDLYKDLQLVAISNLDPMPKVMITEFGFSTSLFSVGFDPAVQAAYLADAYNQGLADPTVDGMAYVSLTAGFNVSPYAYTDAMEVYPIAGPAKPAYQTFASLAGS